MTVLYPIINDVVADPEVRGELCDSEFARPRWAACRIHLRSVGSFAQFGRVIHIVLQLAFGVFVELDAERTGFTDATNTQEIALDPVVHNMVADTEFGCHICYREFVDIRCRRWDLVFEPDPADHTRGERFACAA